jgi:(p)ppGpp synthase/HD superfamily hydrolase
MDIVTKAREYAATKHAGQTKKYVDRPYFNHLEAVVSTLKCAGIDDRTVIAAAYLHDVVEKTDATLSDIVREFGSDIAELVFWLTDSEDEGADADALASAWRLARAPMQAKFIKFADIVDNASRKREYAPNMFRTFGEDKMLILTRMLEFEGASLAQHTLFQKAWRAVLPHR